MASPAQIEANRLNSQKSTGPRSAEGKAASRFNALKFGLEAKSRVLPGEDPAELEATAHAYQRQFQPAGPLEDFLVETLVAADWERRRYAAAEDQVFKIFLRDPDLKAAADQGVFLGTLYAMDGPEAIVLKAVHQRRAAAERAYFRALKELRRAQAERSSPEEAEVAQPVAVPAPLPMRNQQVASSIGFVSPLSERGAHLPSPASALMPESPQPSTSQRLAAGLRAASVLPSQP